MKKVFDKARSAIAKSAKKFTRVSVNRGQTAFPKAPRDLENLGIRCDYDGEIERGGILYNKFQIQPNAGKVNSTIRKWRERNGGTDAVMGVMYVKKDGSTEDVAEGWDNFAQDFMGGPSSLDEGASTASNPSSAAGGGGPNSSDWVWWNTEGIYHRQVNGVDEWYAPKSDTDSELMYSPTQRKSFVKHANGAVVWH